MSSIFQNARLIHIVGEVVILSAVVIYFHLQNQKLTNQIKEIVKKLEEQDELLKKHDVILQRLLTANVQGFQNPGPILRQPQQHMRQMPLQQTAQAQAQAPPPPPAPVQKEIPIRQVKKEIKKVETKPVVLNLDTSIKEVEEEEEDESETEEDLDEEIANELKELEKEEDEILVE